MYRASRLLLVAATAAGCVYPSLKMGAGGTDAAGGTTAAGGGAAGAGGGASGGGGGSGGGGDAGVPDVSDGQPDVPMGGSGGSTEGTTSSTAGTTSSTGGTIISLGGTTSSTGGTTSSTGGTIMSLGGTISSGGLTSTGGVTATGGATSAGGFTGAGGVTTTGGVTAATGGSTGTGGTTYDTSAVTTTCPGAAPAGITTTFCSCVDEGPGYKAGGGFTVANNVWGSNPGPECVWATTSTLWGFASNQPNTGGVKSYPNIGYSPKLLISSINTYTSSFDIIVPGNVGSWEAAYDIWLRSPGGGNTRIEIMIWMYTYKTGPISSIVASTKPTIGDYTWTVHYGSNGSNDVVSFVSNTNVTSGTVDIKAILEWLIANNTTQYGIFDNTWTLDQVQWGWEISSDGGSTQAFVNNSFSVTSS